MKHALWVVVFGLALACGGERDDEGTQAPVPATPEAPAPGESPAPPSADPQALTTAPGASVEPGLDPKALEVAGRAGDFLRAQSSFSFAVVTSYESVQDDGAKFEFGSTRRYLVRRPDRARVEVEERGGIRRTLLYDGSTITMLDSTNDVYAQVRRGGDLDSTIDFVRDDLDAPVPLGELLRNNPRAEFESGLEEAVLIGSETIDGQKADHLFLRNPDTDIELWIAQGERPVLVRITIEYRRAEGRPEFRARFSDWNFQAETPDAAFAFTPPQGAVPVPFAVRPRDEVVLGEQP